jgi:Competence protein
LVRFVLSPLADRFHLESIDLTPILDHHRQARRDGGGDEQAFRASGLSHLLAIARLHLVLVGGFVFFAVRRALAKQTPLSNRSEENQSTEPSRPTRARVSQSPMRAQSSMFEAITGGSSGACLFYCDNAPPHGQFLKVHVASRVAVDTQRVLMRPEERSASGVRRGKAALSSGCKSHPANSLPPEAIGAVMEVTKWLKPSISVSRIGGSASGQAVTRVNAEQASKRTTCRPTRHPYRGRLIRLGRMSEA